MINKDDLFPFTGEAVGALRVLFRQGFLFSFFFLLLGASGTWLFWNLVSKVGLVLGLKCPYVLSNVWPSHSTPLLFMWSIPRSILPGYSVGVGTSDLWEFRGTRKVNENPYGHRACLGRPQTSWWYLLVPDFPDGQGMEPSLYYLF